MIGLRRPLCLAVVGMAAVFAVPATHARASAPVRGGSPACGGTSPDVRVEWMPGYIDAGTPDNLDRVGVLEIGPPTAPNILVLNPGTSAGAGYFQPLADDIVRATNGRWQVWSVERRENQLEDQFVFDQAKRGLVTPQQMADYYLGWLANPSVTNHFQSIPDNAVSYAKNWGLNVEINDLRRVVEAAR